MKKVFLLEEGKGKFRLIVKLPRRISHTSKTQFLKRKPIDRMTRTLAKIAMKQSPTMYAVIHIRSNVIASRQPGRRALLFFPPLLSSPPWLSTKGTFDEVERRPVPKVSFSLSFPLPLHEMVKRGSSVAKGEGRPSPDSPKNQAKCVLILLFSIP